MFTTPVGEVVYEGLVLEGALKHWYPKVLGSDVDDPGAELEAGSVESRPVQKTDEATVGAPTSSTTAGGE